MNNFTDKKIEEMDEKFLTNPQSNFAYATGDQKREVVKWLIDTLTEQQEAIKERIEEMIKKYTKGSPFPTIQETTAREILTELNK